MGKAKLTTSPKDYQNSPPPAPASGPDQPQDKKPFYKKKRYVIPTALVLLVLIFSMSNPDEAPDRSLPPESSSVGSPSESLATSSQPESESSQTEDEGPKKSGIYTLPCGMKIYFSDSVRNDMTGAWKISSTSDSLVPADHAVEYYEEMFSADDEVHGIWNATLKTTTSIKKFGNLLFVDTYEYVDGEEHDANKLFSGTLLDSQIVNLDTGETETALGADIQKSVEEPSSSSFSTEVVQSSPDTSEPGRVIPFPAEPDSPEPTTESEPDSEPNPPVSSSPVLIRGIDANTLVYVSDRSHTIHSVSDCSGMKNYKTMSIGSADAKGYKYCPNCW